MTTAYETLTPEEIAKKGEEIYQTKLKGQLEPKENGKYLVIDVVSGDYFLGESILEANEKAKAKYADRLFYTLKIGYKGIFKMGGYRSNADHTRYMVLPSPSVISSEATERSAVERSHAILIRKIRDFSTSPLLISRGFGRNDSGAGW